MIVVVSSLSYFLLTSPQTSALFSDTSLVPLTDSPARFFSVPTPTHPRLPPTYAIFFVKLHPFPKDDDTATPFFFILQASRIKPPVIGVLVPPHLARSPPFPPQSHPPPSPPRDFCRASFPAPASEGLVVTLGSQELPHHLSSPHPTPPRTRNCSFLGATRLPPKIRRPVPLHPTANLTPLLPLSVPPEKLVPLEEEVTHTIGARTLQLPSQQGPTPLHDS